MRSLELRTFWNNLNTHIVFHTLRYLFLGEREQLINEDGLEVVNLILEFLIEFRQFELITVLLHTGLHRL